MDQQPPLSKAERTRLFIIEQAAPIFNKHGYVGTSMSDVVNATSLTKGAIYGNFADKDELAIAAFKHNMHALTSAFRAHLSTAEGAVDKLMAMSSFYRLKFDEVDENGGCPMLNTATESDDTHPELKQLAAKSIYSWKQLITEVIANGQREGDIRPEIDASTFATLFLAMIEGGIMLARVTGNHRQLFMVLDRIKQIVLNELQQPAT